MLGMDIEVLRQCVKWMDVGRKVVLATVVKTWGSSPRPEGSMLAIRDDGVLVGSVSGGCIEDDLVLRFQQEGMNLSHPESVTYGVTADEAHRFGLPCGGTLMLVVEPLGASSGIRELCAAVEQRRLITRRLDVRSGSASVFPSSHEDVFSFDGQALVTLHGPRYRLLVIGAGQLSRFLSQIALGLDFEVTVCDPRTEYADIWDVPGTELVQTMPDDTVIQMAPDRHCAIVALTHDPKLDDMALLEALESAAFYVAAIGSRRNNETRRQRLKQYFSISDSALERLHGPAGIYIGSRTPSEIAVSIAAEMVAARNGVLDPKSNVGARKDQGAISRVERVAA